MSNDGAQEQAGQGMPDRATMRADMLCMIADLVRGEAVPTAHALFLGMIAVELGSIADSLAEAELRPGGGEG